MSPTRRRRLPALPIENAAGTMIGTGCAVDKDLVLTALHVVDPEPAGTVRVAGRRVVAIGTLPLRRYGTQRHLALICYHRDRLLIGHDLGTVDLALLAVPGCGSRSARVRREPIEDGETVSVHSRTQGRQSITTGSVTSHDNANFVVGLTLSPGGSGAPAIDDAGRLSGLAVIDCQDAGTIFIGPQLLSRFLDRTCPLLRSTSSDRKSTS